MRSIRSSFAGSYTSLLICLPLAGAVAASADKASAVDAVSSGMTIQVTNCNDSGPGSLRAAVAIATKADTVDLRMLACHRITLTSGAIEGFRKNLRLLGPGYAKLTIDGNGASSVVRHHPPAPTQTQTRAEGTLWIQGLSIANGRLVQSFPRGGCIFSRGDVVLVNAQVHDCVAQDVEGSGGESQGGGIYAGGDVSLTHSAVRSSSVRDTSGRSGGGGIWSFAHLTLDHGLVCDNTSAGEAGGAFATSLTALSSTIRGNSAVGLVGGIEISGNNLDDVRVDKSTFSNNRADLIGGAAFENDGLTLITQSTFSGNHSARDASALSVDGSQPATVSIRNSTFTRNVSDADFFGDCIGAIAAFGLVRIHSTIVAGNTCSGQPQDVWGRPQFGDRIRGENNLINVSALALPADTISAAPRLASLADNGGPTKTHALLGDSPAIDRGNNQAGFLYDQRGPKYLRVKGPGPDIGAYER